MKTHIDSLVWIRKQDTTPVERSRLYSKLVIRPRGWRNQKPEPIDLLHEAISDDGVEWYGMPVHYGLKFFQSKICSGSMSEALGHMEDFRSDGLKALYGTLPTPRDKEQGLFFEALLSEAAQRTTVLAEAPTGSGKTVAALYVIARLGRNALVICPTTKIAKQWIKSCSDSDILGLDPKDVGSIIGGKFKYEDKKITVAIIHNLTKRENFPEGFSNYFGTVVWDEAHNLAARTFSRTMINFNSKHRIGLSATPKRRDGCGNVFLYYFGPPCVKHTGDALRAKCRVFDFDWGVKVGLELGSMQPHRRKKQVASCFPRNRMMADKIVKMYYKDRHILVLADEIVHLQTMIGMCSDLGVKDKDLGLFTGSYINEHGKSVSISEDDLDFVAETCRIIFATYMMGKEGLDIPRLDAGIDIYPRADGTQSIGRIRRPLPGKPMPLWVTVRDLNVSSLVDMTRSRLRDYRNSNVEVIENGTT